MYNIHHNTQHPACNFFQHNKGRNAWDLPMADNGTVLLTHKHTGTRAVRFYFSLTGVKGLIEGLNKLCLCPCTWDHEYSSMHGLSSISASWSRSKLWRTKNTKPMGDHSHINNGTHRLPHIWPFIFTPYISPKPLFLPKIVTQSPIFFTLSRILEIFHSKTPNPLEFEKKVPECPQFLWRLSLEDLP